jgi:hypothetical protein
MQQVGSGSLGIAALALNRLINAQTGELVTMVPVRELPQLMRANRGDGHVRGRRLTARRDTAR